MSALQEILAHPALPPAARERLAYWQGVIAERAKDSRVPICVVGEFSNGKSTFLNALTGCTGLLDSDVMPTTSTLFELRRAPSWSVTAHRRDGCVVGPVAVSAAGVAGIGATRERLRALQRAEGASLARILVEGPFSGAAEGARLIDSPGINSGNPEHQRRAQDAVVSSAGVLLVLDAQYPGRAVEVELLREVSRWASRVALVFNKADLLDPDDLPEVREAATAMAREAGLSSAIEVLVVSSLPTRQGPGDPLSLAAVGPLLARWIDTDTHEARTRHLIQLALHAATEASTAVEHDIEAVGAELAALEKAIVQDEDEAAKDAAADVCRRIGERHASLTTGYGDRLAESGRQALARASRELEHALTSSGLAQAAERAIGGVVDGVVATAGQLRDEFVRSLGDETVRSIERRYRVALPDLATRIPDAAALVDLVGLRSRSDRVCQSIASDVRSFLASRERTRESWNAKGGMGIWVFVWFILLISGVGTPVAIAVWVGYKIFGGMGLRGVGALLGAFILGVAGLAMGASSGSRDPGAAITLALLGLIGGGFAGYGVTGAILKGASLSPTRLVPLREGVTATVRGGVSEIVRGAAASLESELLGSKGATDRWISEAAAGAAAAARAAARERAFALDSQRRGRRGELDALRDLRRLCRPTTEPDARASEAPSGALMLRREDGPRRPGLA